MNLGVAFRSRRRSDRAPTFRSFASRNFRLFFTGQLISQVGNWLTTIATTLFVLHLTGSGIAIGVLTACQFAPMLVFGLWAGVIIDRTDKRKLLLGTQVVAALQSVALAVLAFSGDPQLVAIYAVAFIGGCVVAIDSTTRRAFVVELVDESLVTNAVSLNSALMTSARVVGPVVAGALVALFGYGWCFTIDALSYLGPMIALSLMRPAEIRRPPVVARMKHQVRDGLRYVRTVPELWIPLAMTAVISTFTLNFQVVMPLLVTETFSSTEAVFTILFSVLSIGSFLGAIWMARRISLHLAQTVFTAALLGIATLALAVAPTLAVAFPIALVMGLGMTAFITSSTANMQVAADPGKRGRVLALQGVVLLGSTPIGGPILGVVCQTWGARAGLLLGGVAALVAAGFGSWATSRRSVAHPVELEPTGLGPQT
ncbi:MAG: MFS transporter [Acidimicrobiia bacterium]